MSKIYGTIESANSVQKARLRTNELRIRQRDEFERDVREADKVRARAVLQSLEATKLISSHRPGLYKKARA